jgi:hypothetical protein
MRWDRFKGTRPDDYIHNYPEVLDVKVNARSGAYDVVGLINWRGETTSRELSFAGTLGLKAGRYVAFDYWGQRLLGVFSGTLGLEIEPHDTRVVLIHPLLPRPQLIGTSRHITGAHSILALQWDASTSRLSGSSQTVRGEDYALFIHVPEGVTVSRVQATVEGAGEVPVRHEQAGGSLKVSFTGRPEAVAWQVDFATTAR